MVSKQIERISLVILFTIIIIFTTGFTYDSKVVYDSQTSQFVRAEENFMAGMDKMLPGDVLNGVVDIEANNSNVEIFFRTEQLLKSDEKIEEDAIKEIELTINCKGEVIFDGTLADASSFISLGTYYGNAKTSLQYQVRIPPEGDNSLNMINVNNRWIFKAEEIPVIRTVETNDSSNIIVLEGAAIISFLIIVLIKKNYI